MAKEKNTTSKKEEEIDPFEGFNDLTKNVIPGLATEENENITKDDVDEILEEEPVERVKSKKVDSKKKESKLKPEESLEEDDFEVEEEEEPVTKKKSAKDQIEEEISNKSGDKEEDSDFDESEYVEPFFDILAEELGWEFDEGEFKPKTITEFKEYIGKVIEDNSQPNYSSELSERFDKYILNGGDPSKFIQINFGEVDYNKIDIAKVDNQKRVLRDYYKEKGFNETKIDKNIERLADLDELETEAKDALDELKSIQTEKVKRLDAEQTKTKQRELESHRKFIEQTEQHLEKLDNIAGIKLNKKEKEELLPYIFQIGRDGKTQQQKDYESNPIDYMIATAYFYRHKEELKKRFENGAVSSAAERFKQKQKELKSKQSKNKSDYPNEEVDSEEDWLTTLTGGINKPKK